MLGPLKPVIHLKKMQNTKSISKTKKQLITFSLCLVLIASLALTTQIKPALARTIHVAKQLPYDYQTIQEAINNAVAGDRIEVQNGTYNERVVINAQGLDGKALNDLTLAGADPATTIIDGTASGTVIAIEPSRATITGFTIRNAGLSQNAITSQKNSQSNDQHHITGNIIKNNGYGISVAKSNGNYITDNTFIDNAVSGIELNDASSAHIERNTISGSTYGVRIMISATGNTVDNNTISRTDFAVHVSASSTGNTISNNILTGRTAGVYINSDNSNVNHNTITNSAYGIHLEGSKSATVKYNTLTNNSYGVRIYWKTQTLSVNHNVSDNRAVNNGWAIELINSFNNNFAGNWLQNNTWGVNIQQAGSNTFYRNNFLTNNVQVTTDSDASWSKNGQGNYWSDYAGHDTNGDGIGDTDLPYLISPGGDSYPLMYTWSERDVSVERVTASTSSANVGTIVGITVRVKNKDNITSTETFTVTAKYNNTIIGTPQQVLSLAKGATQDLVFNWNTTGVTPGTYRISAEASKVADELNTDNNKKTNGTVTITAPLIGDINGDGTINQQDLTLLMQEYGLTPSSPTWNPNADLNADNIVNEQDLYIIGRNYGNTN